MANFDAQITDLVGGTIDDTACDQWAADACKEIIHQLPANLKSKCTTVTALSDGSTLNATTMDLDGIGDILHVTRETANSGYLTPCRKIDAQHGGLATDSSSLAYFGTVTDPVYWIDSNTSDVGTLFVKPNPTAAQACYVHHITYPSVNVDSVDTIANFPDEAEHLVVLYVSTRQLLQYQLDQHSSLPTLTLPVVPAPPSLSAQTVTISGTAPTFTAPVVSPDFSQVNTYIDTDEDVELASAKLQEISTQLNEYANNIQKEQAEFNEENVEYQSKLQKDVTDAQFSDANEARKLSKYQAEVSTYSANLNTNVQDFTTKLQKFTTKYQWYGDQYAKLSAEYTRGLAAIKGA